MDMPPTKATSSIANKDPSLLLKQENLSLMDCTVPVSYTHLDVYKRQIPLRTKLSMEEHGYTFNENGVPCCPHDSTLPMKREGSKSHLRSKLPSMKFVCPKMKWEYNREDVYKRQASEFWIPYGLRDHYESLYANNH